LEIYFNAKKEKKYQKADWTIRPIDKEMLSYAVGDSKYLIKLKKILLTLMKNKRTKFTIQNKIH
jgi:ribonuclease D